MSPRFLLLIIALLGLGCPGSYAQEQSETNPDSAPVAPLPEVGLGIPTTAARAAAELRAEEKQRILGVVPDFSTTNIHDAAPLSTGQKFQLALKGAVDPFAFVAAGLDAGIDQTQKNSPGYGGGMQGYSKRFASAYLDAMDGSILGDALLPSLLHQDPRYFRQGTGSFGSRFYHAVASAWRSKNDDGTWSWNYSNILGNIAAGGIANAYYPAQDRGAALTFQRAFTVTAEGSVGAVFFEFWPDISRKFLSRKQKRQT